MPKRKQNKINKSRNNKSRNNKYKNKSRRYRIKGGTRPSVSCANSGSVDHNPPQWNSKIMGGSHINDDLYNQYTDMTPYSISR